MSCELTSEVQDRFARARAVADAVLYEGYVLYPYRASAPKNQLRWQFGVLAPRAFSEAEGSERWATRTECLVSAGDAPVLAVRIRCLHVQHRVVEAATADGAAFAPVAGLEVDGTMFVPWDEAVDQVVDVTPRRLLPLATAGYQQAFRFAGSEEVEEIRSGDGAVLGRIVRRRQPVEGLVRMSPEWAEGPGALVKVSVTVENTTDWCGAGARRDDAVARSLVAVHTMLAVDDGAFISLLDPPEDARSAVAGCRNDGTFPVLIGTDNVVLSSPIILYDHPEVAPESPGDLYDATEIDEILALRVLTLTDEEKAEARGTDRRAAAIIDRCDDMPPELWESLHGAVRILRPATAQEPGPESVPWWDPGVDGSFDPWTDQVTVGGVDISKGSAVRLRPSRRADAQDLFLRGLTATVAGVFRDVDGNEHVAVTIDDDPATEALEWQGRYLFFYPDEIEPLSGSEASP
ncbi:MAG: hypothetical protein M3083_20555 [Actinomycetota bacterium]|nr:hypothetical protein [Actinomycetota bacterium]